MFDIKNSITISDGEDYEILESLIDLRLKGIKSEITLNGKVYTTEMYPDEMYNLCFGKSRKEFFHEKNYAVCDLSTERLKRFEQTKMANDELLKDLKENVFPLWEKKVDEYYLGSDKKSIALIWETMVLNKFDIQGYFDYSKLDFSDSYFSSGDSILATVAYYDRVLRILDLAAEGKISEAENLYLSSSDLDVCRISNYQLYLRSSRFAPELESVMEKDIIEHCRKKNFDHKREYNYYVLKKQVEKVKKLLSQEQNQPGAGQN